MSPYVTSHEPVPAAIVAVVDQVLYQTFPNKGYFLAPAFIIAKLYSNSMMVIFNSRLEMGILRDNIAPQSGSSVSRRQVSYPAFTCHKETEIFCDVDLAAYPNNRDVAKA